MRDADGEFLQNLAINNRLPTDVEKSVKEFCENGQVSRICPGKKAVVDLPIGMEGRFAHASHLVV